MLSYRCSVVRHNKNTRDTCGYSLSFRFSSFPFFFLFARGHAFCNNRKKQFTGCTCSCVCRALCRQYSSTLFLLFLSPVFFFALKWGIKKFMTIGPIEHKSTHISVSNFWSVPVIAVSVVHCTIGLDCGRCICGSFSVMN